MNQTAEQKADALLLSMIFPERFPMNQTQTPLTDALSDSYPGHDEKDARLLKHARSLELALAKANADKAVLVEVLADAQRMRPALLKAYGAVPEAVLDFCNSARAALSQVRAHEDEPVCPYCNKSCATILDVALHVQATHSREA